MVGKRRWIRRLVIVASVIAAVGVGGMSWLAAHRDMARERAIAKYEQIRPGMTAHQVQEVMSDLPPDTCYSDRPGGTYISAAHRFNITAHFGANGVLARKYLIEGPYSPNWYWLTASSKLGIREYRQWP
jgi:hypothetical protein